MRCPECAADVPPLREFCPKCGTPTDPGLRERLQRRPSTRPPEELKRNRKTVLIGAAALLLALGVAGKFSWPEAASKYRRLYFELLGIRSVST